MGKTIGVLSLKGGVGKTSVVVSLGAALSEIGKKVLLIDTNFSAPNLGVHLNLIDPEITIHHILDRSANPKEAIQKVANLDIIPASIFWNKQINYLKLKDKIKSLKKIYDVILLDSSPALNDETLATMNASDELIVVTTPDYLSLVNAIKAIKEARQKGAPIIGLVLNKVFEKKFELSINDIEKTLDVPVLAVIPHDINFLKSLSEFTPYTIYKPRSRGTDEYKKLASTLVGEKYKPFTFRTLKWWVSPSRPDINREIFYERIFKEN